MNIVFPRSLFAGLAVYAAVIVLAATPVFPDPLSSDAVVKFVLLASIASLGVAIMLVAGLDRRAGDAGGYFTQAILGIAICAGAYALLSRAARPSVVDLSLLWIIVGISQLGTRRVIALLGVYFAFYLYACFPQLVESTATAHGDAVYTLAVSLVLGGFLYWRAHEYERLMGEHAGTAAQLALAEEQSALALDRIHDITVQDSETTALKYSHFMDQVAREKRHADAYRSTFSIGLIEIDGFSDLAKRLGETSAKQVLRQFTERAEACIRLTDTAGAWPAKFQPLGRISGGRFGLLLPGIPHQKAMLCARRLHDLPDFNTLRTNAGVIGITLSIGMTEYSKSESVEEVMQLAEHALKLVTTHSGDAFRGLRLVSAG